MNDPSSGEVPPVTNEVEAYVRERIIHALTIYPRLSSSLIQSAIGPSTPTILWRPIMDKLLAEGVLVKVEEQHKSPSGRNQVYTLISLAPKS